MIIRKTLNRFVFRSFSISTVCLSKHKDVRLRFAPSPTGNMHLGGLRTALYNYIYAKQHNGKFILRFEDTDRTRILPGSDEDIENSLMWAGLSPDEGPKAGGDYGPYIQSERLELYKKRAEELIFSGRAYRCFCSTQRLDLLRKHQLKNSEKPRYDGKCRVLSMKEQNEKLQEFGGHYVIRFGLKQKTMMFSDIIYGDKQCDILEYLESDPIIIKSDGFPTYHFANVVDDHEMEISHVLRGSEWISSTHKHLQIYEAFDWTPPQFGHFPLIFMKDGTKMSKRNNQSQVRSWVAAGYRPTAMINFLTSMGGGLPVEKQNSLELWDIDRIINEFDFHNVIRHPGSVDLDRLNIYNVKDLQKVWSTNPNEIVHELNHLLKTRGIHTDLNNDMLIGLIDRFMSGRITTLEDLLSQENMYIWEQPRIDCNAELFDGLNLSLILKNVSKLIQRSDLEDKASILGRLKQLSKDLNIEYPKFMVVLRKVLTNQEKGPPVHEIFLSLGKARLLQYLDKYI